MRQTPRRPKRSTPAKGRKAIPRPIKDEEHKTEGAR
jgi:hypothetical protein